MCCPLIRLTPVHTTYRIRATSLCVRKNSLFQLPAALLSTFCPWNSAPRLIIALLTAFDHVDTRFTPLSCHVYIILDVLVVHCRHSGGKCLDLSAWVSARSFRGTRTHTHTHKSSHLYTPLPAASAPAGYNSGENKLKKNKGVFVPLIDLDTSVSFTQFWPLPRTS